MKYRTILLFVLAALFLAACEDAGDPVIPVDNTPVPVITSVAPDSGKAGDTITVRGINFGATSTGNSVRFGSIGGSVLLWNDSTVRTTVPASLAGGSIQMSVVRGAKISNSTAFKVLSAVSAVSFTGDIRPLITAYGCAGCHPSNGGFSVATHATIITRVSIGNGDGSLLVQKLRGTASGSRMPAGGPFMSTTEIQKFVDWINQGALNN
jgi:hypothetical protein